MIELDDHELLSYKMNVVVGKVLEAAGMVKTKGLYDSDIQSTLSRGGGRLGWHLGEVCAENKHCYFFLHWDLPPPNMRTLPSTQQCLSDDKQ